MQIEINVIYYLNWFNSHLCVGLTPTSDNAEDLPKYVPGC